MSRVTPRTLGIVLAISALTFVGWLVTRSDQPLASDTGQYDLADGRDEILLRSDVLEDEDDSDNEILQDLNSYLGAGNVFEGELDGYLLLGNVGDPATIVRAYLGRDVDTEPPGERSTTTPSSVVAKPTDGIARSVRVARRSNPTS